MRAARRLKRLAGRFRRRLLGQRPGPVILMYHRIAEPEADPWGLAVPPERFDDQLGVLRKRRTVLPLVEFADAHRSGRLPGDAVAITFDDGYACNLTTAAPLLNAHRLPATIFLMTGKVGDPTEFWSDALERIVTGAGVQTLCLDTDDGKVRVDLGPPDPPGTIRRWDASQAPRTPRQRAYLDLWRTLRDFPAIRQAAAMAALHRQSGTPTTARPSHRALTVAEARTLAHAPSIEIGAHSVTHARLSGLSSEDQLREIAASRAACAELVGKPPASFAYPYGDFEQETVDLVARAGFRVACTTLWRAVRLGDGPFELPRAPVGDWSGRELLSVLEDL